jgi:hypothetical protein
MKLIVNETMPEGWKKTYLANAADSSPDPVRKLLSIAGVRSVFHTSDFYAVDRFPQADWRYILTEINAIFADHTAGNVSAIPMDTFGEVKVLLQTFRGIPMQVRVIAGNELVKGALPERFVEAAMQAGSSSPTLLRERQLEEIGFRYGEIQEILKEIIEETDASYPAERLGQLVEQAIQLDQFIVNDIGIGNTAEKVTDTDAHNRLTLQEIQYRMYNYNWKIRYAALQMLKPDVVAMPILIQSLSDQQSSIRRLAVVYLGDLRSPEALPYLFEALKDPSVAVRRTVGDTLSDLGDPAAIQPMINALKDPNKLVRWRAARFLYEVGDESAIAALQETVDDSEFEVALQARIALERIQSGETAVGSVWQQMANRKDSHYS